MTSKLFSWGFFPDFCNTIYQIISYGKIFKNYNNLHFYRITYLMPMMSTLHLNLSSRNSTTLSFPGEVHEGSDISSH